MEKKYDIIVLFVIYFPENNFDAMKHSSRYKQNIMIDYCI